MADVTPAPAMETMAPAAPNEDREDGERDGGGKMALVGPDGSVLKSEEKPERDWSVTQFPIEFFENRVVVRRDDREQLTDGGLYLPPNAQPKVMTGTIVAVGPGMMKNDGSYVPLQGTPALKIGDRVVFEKFRQAIEITVEGRNYHIYRDNDILGRAPKGIKVRQGPI